MLSLGKDNREHSGEGFVGYMDYRPKLANLSRNLKKKLKTTQVESLRKSVEEMAKTFSNNLSSII